MWLLPLNVYRNDVGKRRNRRYFARFPQRFDGFFVILLCDPMLKYLTAHDGLMGWFGFCHNSLNQTQTRHNLFTPYA